jgi:hypothetical protein
MNELHPRELLECRRLPEREGGTCCPSSPAPRFESWVMTRVASWRDIWLSVKVTRHDVKQTRHSGALALARGARG